MAPTRGKAGSDTRTGSGHASSGEKWAPGAALAPAVLVVVSAVVVGLDAFRLGFYADDFDFLDVARRMDARGTAGPLRHLAVVPAALA